VNCPEFHERITAAVDSRLDSGEMAAFLEHASRCLPCRQSFVDERSIVAFVHQRVPRVCAPPDVVARIARRLREDAGASPSLLARAWRARLLRPAVGFALACAAILVIVVRLSPVSPTLSTSAAGYGSGSENDIIGQSVRNYHAVLKGDIVPQLVSEIPESLRAFFAARRDFAVFIPVMKECTLVGGSMDEYKGTPLAHLVYKHGDQTIYLFQACRETVHRGKMLRLPDDAWTALDRSGWYCGSTDEGDGVVVWVKEATICTAVARMPGEHLMAHLAAADGMGEASPW
jgi:hypothetical protein